MNKKVLYGVIAVVAVVVVVLVCVLVGGSNKAEDNVEGTLDALMARLYEGIPEDELPRVMSMPVTQENAEYFIGTNTVAFTEALASEPLMSSIAHSVVLVRLNNAKDAEAVKKEILAKVNPAKWICVEVERQNIRVASRGNLVVLIMDNLVSDQILANFENL